jgi:uncharacterized protein (TIGR02217 family)
MFLNIKLPDDISYGAIGGPEFSTSVTILNNGHEHRNINWEYPRHSYNISYDILSTAMVKNLLDFFLVAKGKAHSFRFKDWLDYEGKSEPLSQIANNALNNKTFQINKTYKIKDIIFTRKITKLMQNSIRIYNQEKTFLENTDYIVDYDSGLVTFKQSDATNLLIDFEFDTHVRFDNDYCELTVNRNSIYSWKSIKLIEIME